MPGVISVSFSPDGKRLASGHSDTSALVWDVGSLIVGAGDPGPLDGLWDGLASNDASRVFAAMQVLRKRGLESVRLLKDRLKQEDVPGRVRKALGDLDHEDFDVREGAERELLSLGCAAEPAIQEAVGKTASAEMRMRGSRILEALQRPYPVPPGESLRRWRALQALEWIGLPEAREVLEALEKESPSLRERNEANAALGRLNRVNR